MADQLHSALYGFRETMLTAIARLEFQIRDTLVNKNTYNCFENGSSHSSEGETLDYIVKRLDSLEAMMQKTKSNNDDTIANELLNIQAPSKTKNILISTPALAAAVAAASAAPPSFSLDETVAIESEEEAAEEEAKVEEEDVVIESEVEAAEEEAKVEKEYVAVESEVEEEEAEEEEAEEEEEAKEGEVIEEDEEEEEDSIPDLKQVKIKGKTYYMDNDNIVYLEMEDGYEQVGVYNSKTDSIEAEADEDEDEEDAVEVEEFVYKGTTYQRDTKGNVYNDDGEQIGTWNGKKIVLQ